jgi:hypothetical protein
MILRRASVATDADYLTGQAHPVVFSEQRLNVEKMVELAHQIAPDATPPLVQLQVVAEDQPRVGIDYFEVGPAEKIFDTPGAIARVYRTTARERRIVITAATSFDVNDRPLKFHWSVLQARPGGVTIKPLKEDSSLVELRVQWHERFASAADPKLQTNRIDIGVFAHNGAHYSAPGFVTFYCLDDEERQYDERGRIAAVTYRSPAQGGNYADPLVHNLRDWRDEYHYDDDVLTGWTRHRGQEQEQFTAHGHLVTQTDAKGRAAQARKVGYVARAAQGGQLPVLEMVVSTEVLTYAYDSAADRVGHFVENPGESKSKER